MKKDTEYTFRIILQAPVPDVRFALARGSGANHTLVQIQEADDNDLLFTLTAKIKSGKDGQPDFSGPFVQGPVAERFVYINIGTSAGQLSSPWTRRLKVPFRGITWEMVNQLTGDPARILETVVPGTAKDGTPTCATVKPFGGWVVK